MPITYIQLADNDRRISFAATAGQTAFSTDFLILDDDDLDVYQNGVLKTNITDYVVTNLNVQAGCTVTLNSGATLHDTILIIGNSPIERTSGYQKSGSFRGDTVDTDFKKFLIIAQQLRTAISRCFQLDPTDTAGLSTIIGTTSRANKVFAFDSNGNADITQELGSWAGNWVTSRSYTQRDFVNFNGSIYICLITHTSGVFATDLAAAKWALVIDGSGIVVADGSITEPKFSFSDITTANSSTSQHGLLRKLSGVTSNVLLGDGTWASIPTHAARHQTGGADPIALDTLAAATDVLTLNASTTAHGLLPKLSGDLKQVLNGNGAFVSIPTHAVFHRRGNSDAIALDELGVPTDTTALNVSTSAHGLVPKIGGTATKFFRDDGTYAIPTASVTVPSNAAKSDQTAATSASLYVTPLVQQHHPSAVKVRGTITLPGSTPTLVEGYNISSFTDSGTGVTVVNFTTNFANSNCTAVACLAATGSYEPPFCTSGAAGSVTVTTRATGDTATDVAFNLMVMGIQ